MTMKDRLKQWVEEMSEETAARSFERLKEDSSLITDQAQPFNAGESGSSLSEPFGQASREERRRRVRAARGCAAHLPGTVEDFHRRKQEEIDLEEEQAARRMSGIG